MLDAPDEVGTLLAGKLALKYSGSDLDAMRSIAAASKKRSLADFNASFGSYRFVVLCVGPSIVSHRVTHILF